MSVLHQSVVRDLLDGADKGTFDGAATDSEELSISNSLAAISPMEPIKSITTEINLNGYERPKRNVWTTSTSNPDHNLAVKCTGKLVLFNTFKPTIDFNGYDHHFCPLLRYIDIWSIQQIHSHCLD